MILAIYMYISATTILVLVRITSAERNALDGSMIINIKDNLILVNLFYA